MAAGEEQSVDQSGGHAPMIAQSSRLRHITEVTVPSEWISNARRTLGHSVGNHAPGRQDSPQVVHQVIHHLLLAHGTMDNNVPPYNTLLVVDALIKANKDFDLLLIPTARHGYGTADNYMMRRRWDYFVKHLLGAEPPKEFEFTLATPLPARRHSPLMSVPPGKFTYWSPKPKRWRTWAGPKRRRPYTNPSCSLPLIFPVYRVTSNGWRNLCF